MNVSFSSIMVEKLSSLRKNIILYNRSPYYWYQKVWKYAYPDVIDDSLRKWILAFQNTV